MTITVKAVDPTATVAFVPKFNGEFEKKAADPDYAAVTFHIAPLSEAEYERFQEFESSENGVQFKQAELSKLVFAKAVKIEHLVFEKRDGAAVEIRTGAELEAHRDVMPGALKHLFAEVGIEIIRISSLTPGEEKN